MRFFGRTDETGHAILSPFPAAVSRVTVEANGFLPYEYRRRDGTGSMLVESADGNLRAHVELEPAAWVSGRVLLPAGLEDAPFEPSIYVSIRALDAPGYEGYRVHDHDARTVDARWLEADGRFRMPVPPTGVYVLEAILDGFRLWESASVEVVPGQEDVEVRIAIEESVPPPEELSAWVLDLRGPDGEPVEDAELRVTLDSGWDEARLYSGSPWAEVSRDADGTWRIPIATDYPPIWIDVRARLADGSSTGRKTFGPFAATGGRRRLDLPPPGTIAGRVLAPDGAGLGGAKVWATSVPPSGDRTVSSRRSHEVQTRCDDQGRFAFADLGQARYRLRVWGEGAWLAPDYAFVPCGAGDVVLQAHPSVASTITVLDPDGVPLARCYVGVDARSGPRGDRAPLVGCTTRTGSDGRARLERLEAGATYRLWVAPDEDDLRIIDLEGWTPEDTTVRLKRQGHMAGKVVDQDGEPLARVHVGLRDSAGDWFTRKTSRKGEFSMRKLAPGAARIVAAWGKVKPEDLEGRPVPWRWRRERRTWCSCCRPSANSWWTSPAFAPAARRI